MAPSAGRCPVGAAEHMLGLQPGPASGQERLGLPEARVGGRPSHAHQLRNPGVAQRHMADYYLQHPASKARSGGLSSHLVEPAIGLGKQRSCVELDEDLARVEQPVARE